MMPTPPPSSPERARRALLVDYGGVLTTSIGDAFEQFARVEGLAPGSVSAALRSGPDMRRLLDGLEEGALPEAEFERELGLLLGVPPEGLIGRLLAAVRPDERMISAVRAVRRAGMPTGLVSNSWGVDIYPAALLDELFDATVISGEVGMRKPSPGIYLHASRALGLDPADCVFVDDLTRNLPPAAELGMATIHHTDSAVTVPEIARLLGLRWHRSGIDAGEDVPREGMAGLPER
jgi:putative hydrolase of the HAD superfamily